MINRLDNLRLCDVCDGFQDLRFAREMEQIKRLASYRKYNFFHVDRTCR